jgi:Uri superfamily endonuclease
VVALSPSLTQKRMAYRCLMFRVSSFMTSFTNTSWHVQHLLHTGTAMPLQVGMEEEPKSKAVRVSGLQYYQYS